MADRKAAPSPAAHDTDDASLMLVTFACADARVGLEAQRVRSSRRIPVDAQPPAPMLSALLGLPAPARMSQPFCLELKSGEGSVEVLVEGPVELGRVVRQAGVSTARPDCGDEPGARLARAGHDRGGDRVAGRLVGLPSPGSSFFVFIVFLRFTDKFAKF